METRRQDMDILSHQFRGQQGGERERQTDIEISFFNNRK